MAQHFRSVNYPAICPDTHQLWYLHILIIINHHKPSQTIITHQPTSAGSEFHLVHRSSPSMTSSGWSWPCAAPTRWLWRTRDTPIVGKWVIWEYPQLHGNIYLSIYIYIYRPYIGMIIFVGEIFLVANQSFARSWMPIRRGERHTSMTSGDYMIAWFIVVLSQFVPSVVASGRFRTFTTWMAFLEPRKRWTMLVVTNVGHIPIYHVATSP